jgi:trimethylamine--corrinoid protein Co-methyltransferase
VERAVQSAPSTLRIFRRGGDVAMELDGSSASFGAHTDAPDLLDPFEGARRPCTERAVGLHASLIEQLDHIAFATASGMVSDRDPEVGDRAALAQCLLHTEKPVLAMPVTLESLRDCHEMALMAAGGADALRQEPSLVVYAEPVSPLVHPDDSIRRLLYCAEHDIPVVYSGYAAMGGTAPMSPAAITVQLCAESLSALTIHQLKNPGAPFIFGGMASVMDMQTTVFSYGAPEFQRGNTLMAEMADVFALPNFGTAGTSDAQVFDGQAVMEATSSCMLAYLSGADLVHDVGLLGNATVVMPEMIVATDEIVAMLPHLIGPLEASEEDLAVDVFKDVGPGGEFVTHEHTFAHFRDVWYPKLLFRGGAEAWEASQHLTFEERVNERTKELLEAAGDVVLPDETAAAILDVVDRAEERARA